MARLRTISGTVKGSSKYWIFIITALLLSIWWIVTPSGILGKADAIGYAFCHRIDLRSFHLGDRQLPFCVRCTGQYLGAVLGLLFQVIIARHHAGFPSRRVLVLLGLLILGYGVDGLNSTLYLPPLLRVFPHLPHLYEPSNTLRLISGSGMGLVIAALIYPAFVGSALEHPGKQPALSGLSSLVGLIAITLLADWLILKGSLYVLFIAALTSAGGVILLLCMAYAIILLRLAKRENTYSRLSQIGLPLVIGFLIAMSQIALFDLVRFIITGTWNGLVFG